MQQWYMRTKVCENNEISSGIFKLSLEWLSDKKPEPGQFVMLRTEAREPFLSRPISIHDADGKRLYFVFEARGEGTRSLSRLRKGSEIEVLGPLGNGYKVENIGGRVAVVTGGMGIAPMNYVVKGLKNCTIDMYAGFRNEAYGIEELREHANNIYITTENGSTGHKGYITEIFDPLGYDTVLCCGPEIMMKRVVEICNANAVPVYVSMEKHMACGVGACLVCSCRTNGGNKRVCRDGPVFSGKDVIFDA